VIHLKQTLLIIDAQQELMEGNEHEEGVYQKDVLIHTINAVIEKALAKEIDIVFVRDVDVAEGKGPGFHIHENIHVPTSATIFNKAATNSFYGTLLLEHLTERNVEHLVIMGCKTEHCIDTAVRTATVNGFDVTLIEDGHSTCNSTVLQAEQIIAHHNKLLHGHYNVDHFSMVRKGEESVFEPLHYQHR